MEPQICQCEHIGTVDLGLNLITDCWKSDSCEIHKHKREDFE